MRHVRLSIGVHFSQHFAAHWRGFATAKGAVSALALAGSLVGCSGHGSDVAESKAALNANPHTTDFAVYAQNSATLMDRVGVTGGDVGVRLVGTGPFLGGVYELTMAADAHVDTARSVLANRILLQDRARVGDIQVNQLTQQNHPTFTHQYPFPATAMPALPPMAPVTPGTAALTVKLGGTQVANPGSYGAVSVGDRGILRLNGGVYQLASLQIGNDARIEALAPVQVRVAGRFGALDRSFIGAAAGVTLTAGDLRIEVSGKNGNSGSLTDSPKAAVFGNDANVHAVMLVPNGTLLSGQRAIVVGAYVARDVYMDLDSTITYQGGVGPSGCLQSCDDGNPCTIDACSVGVCVHSSSPAGTSCADSNACNGAEKCDGAGHCQTGTPVVCAALDQCHVVGICNSATGLCSNPAKPNGTACNDANPCTKTDVCTAGVCGGTAYTCNDGLDCTADSCNGDGTCTFAVTAGNCLVGGLCFAGTTTNPSNQCEQCMPETSQTGWSPKSAGTACNDGNACTSGDVCNGASACGGAAYLCNDSLACTADSCNGDGTCSFAILPGNCVINGACYAADATNPANQCQTCAPSTSATSWTAKSTGTVCNDNNACTKNDICNASVCAGTAYSCDDGLACTADSCNGDGTCSHTIAAGSCVINGACYASGASNPTDSCQICNPSQATTWSNQVDGTTCNDSSACTPADGGTADGGTDDGGTDDGGTSDDGGATCPSHTCIAGACTGNCVPGHKDCTGLTPRVCDATGNWQNQPSCDDGNPCTTDSCSIGACVHTLNPTGTSCSDGNACNGAETCNDTGVCLPGSPLAVVDDGNPCTADQCDPVLGITHVLVPEGTPCSDGNVCHAPGKCNVAGLCVFDVPPSPTPGPSALGRTSWEMNRGEGLVSFGFTFPTDGSPSEYAFATIPPAGDSGWGAAPNGDSIGFSEPSTLCGHADCRTAGQFTYFQTLVSVPSNTQLATFTIAFSGVDDGVRTTIFNSDHPNGVVVPGSYVYLGGSGTANLAALVKSGEVNRVVVTQVDDCCSQSYLSSAQVVLNGTTLPVAPPAWLDDGNPCTVDTCSPATGILHTPVPAGTSCSDGNACNGAETCDGAGQCQLGTPVVCAPSDQCHAAGVCDSATGLCSSPAKPDGTACDDGNLNTTADVCTGGICAGTAITCNDLLFSNWNADLCTGRTDTSPFTLGGASHLTMMQIWVNRCEAGTTSLSYTLTDVGNHILSAAPLALISCDPYQPCWCAFRANQSLDVPAGTYAVQSSVATTCTDSASNNTGLIQVFGCPGN